MEHCIHNNVGWNKHDRYKNKGKVVVNAKGQRREDKFQKWPSSEVSLEFKTENNLVQWFPNLIFGGSQN